MVSIESDKIRHLNIALKIPHPYLKKHNCVSKTSKVPEVQNIEGLPNMLCHSVGPVGSAILYSITFLKPFPSKTINAVEAIDGFSSNHFS